MDNKNISIETLMNEGQLHAKIAQYTQIIMQLYKNCEELEKENKALKEKSV
jgi:hypothetical protein